MASLIEVYWDYLGSYLGQWMGAWVDKVPFAVSEPLLQFSIWLCVAGIFCFIMGHRIPKWFGVGPILLLIMAFSQGISSWDWVPSAHREPFFDRLGKKEISREELDQFLEVHRNQLKAFPEKLYSDASMDAPLDEVNKAMDKALALMNLKPGRHVQSVKKLWGITRVLGLAYGGPAYHDVITSEVVMASQEDYPATKAWRWVCAVHEVAHAQGFTREMDAEILTYLALRESEHPLLKALCSCMVLSKSGQNIDYPKVFEEEWKGIRKQRENLHQPLIKVIKSLGQALSIQNSQAKYGGVDRDREIPLDHEFFASLVLLESVKP